MFQDTFMWGAASASAQIEGAYNEDGKCLSIWDIADGHIQNGDTCHVACDHYHRYKEDVQILKKMGIKNYRFSISWCRIMPEEGKINPLGIEFYKKLVKELIENGIQPLVTLYHWDLPVWVNEKGGWKNPQIIDWFLAYTKVCVEALYPSVTYWMTFNEPACFLRGGFREGWHAPFEKHTHTFGQYLRVMLLTHAKAVKLIRELTNGKTKVGIVMASTAYVPFDESPKEIEKARKFTFGSRIGIDANSQYLDPIVLGKHIGYGKGSLSEEDLSIIKEPIDFIGINFYQPCNEICKDPTYGEHPKTMMDWNIDGRGLYWVARFYFERYGLPVMITENGMANPDIVSEDGLVHDEIRTNFLKDYLTNLKRAVDENIPVLGYLYWSIMDNFEWTMGYGPRFGLVHVDYETQKRTIKDSAHFYSEVIATNGKNL